MSLSTPEHRPVEPWEWCCLGLIVLTMLSILAQLAWKTGVTADEPSHLLSAYLYWAGGDDLRPADLPPLIKITGGWVPFRMGLPVPYDRPDLVASKSEWSMALEMMLRMTDRLEIQRLYYFSRLPLLVFPMGCCVLLWWWGRQLFGPAAGLGCATMFAFSPNFLGHGALFKNDIAASFAFLLLGYACWRWWQAPHPPNAILLGLAVAIAFTAKYSLLIFLPIVPVLILARTGVRRSILPLFYMFFVAYIGVLAAYQFDVSLPRSDWFRDWKNNPALPQWYGTLVKTFPLLLPRRFWEGISTLWSSNALGTGVYLLGGYHHAGNVLYFPIALALKLEAPMQIMTLGGFLLVVQSLDRRRDFTTLFWLVPPVLYITLASQSSLQLGTRLVFPAVLYGILVAGKFWQWACQRRQTALGLAGLCVWLIAADIRYFPHYLSFFNFWAGGPKAALSWLSDSNVDWGQDLPYLKEWMDRERVERLHLSYFGTDNAFARLDERKTEMIAPPWNDELAKGQRQIQLEPGYYAVSATLLTGQLFDRKYRDFFQPLRDREPIARAGYSIYIYRIEPAPQGQSLLR